MHPTPHTAAEPHSHLSYSYPPDLPADYNEAEATWLRSKYYATKVAGSRPEDHMQSLVVTADLALNMDLTQEAPRVLAEVTQPVVMYANRGEGTTCTPA